MLNAYSVVEETPEETTYEFKTIYMWLLYGILAIGGLGLVIGNTWLTTLSGVSMFLYFFTVSLRSRKIGTLTKQAAMKGSVRLSGSQWSFSNPLRITIRRPGA